MRVLLLHPDDSPLDAPWNKTAWDLVVDLGWAGRDCYGSWSSLLGCPVRSYLDFCEWFKDCLLIKESLKSANGSLVDAEGVDWWELLAPSQQQRLLEVVLLKKIAVEIGRSAEVRVTRPHSMADALGKILDLAIKPFNAQSLRSNGRFYRLARVMRTFSLKQAARIAADKWDADYGLRRFFTPRGAQKDGTRTLLPSAYRNASRAQLAYAGLLPERNFLLVTTRADGTITNPPQHVKTASLSAYASIPRDSDTEREIHSLTRQWHELRSKLERTNDPILAPSLRFFNDFDAKLQAGLRIRDAWRNVLECERIDSVLCADENNPYTRLPVLLAKRRSVPAIYCSHGALDSNLQRRGSCSDVYLVKGEMEKDYLSRECAIAEEKIFVGAAQRPSAGQSGGAHDPGRTHIVFFSEPYELYSGRTKTFYQELFPALCALAREHDKKVMLKLHPFESLKEREKLVDHILASTDRNMVEVTAEPMSERLMQRTWTSLTVESSVAVECALAGVPSFLCGWFDIDLYSYGRQYARFGAAQILSSPQEIARIPELMSQRKLGEKTRLGLSRPISPEEFRAVLEGRAGLREKLETRAS